MPLTEFDENAALILIDLQKGVVGLPSVHPAEDVIKRAAELSRAFRKRGLPVVLVNVTGRAPGRTDAGFPNMPLPADWSELVKELEQNPQDHLISKQRWGAFVDTDLDQYLRGRGVTQVVLAGVATSIGVESTARGAFDRGYNVVLVSDAMTDLDANAHVRSIETIFPRLGQVDNTENVLKLLERRSAQKVPV
jgi:nicotinamidase-related amidase